MMQKAVVLGILFEFLIDLMHFPIELAIAVLQCSVRRVDDHLDHFWILHALSVKGDKIIQAMIRTHINDFFWQFYMIGVALFGAIKLYDALGLLFDIVNFFQ